MKNYQDQDFTNRHPHVGFRTNPDVKEMLLQLQKDNGGTLSDTVESVVINGLDHMCSRSPNPDGEDDVDVMERFDSYIQDIKDKSYNEGFADSSKKAVEETNEVMNKIPKSDFLIAYPNSVMAKEINDDDDEEGSECPCGAEFDGQPKFCPECGEELDWDVDEKDDGGILAGLLKWNNGE